MMDHHDLRLPTAIRSQDQLSVFTEITLNGSQAELNYTHSLHFKIEEPGQHRSRVRLIAILVALYLSLFLAALDQSIVATAVPTITSELKSSRGYVWIGSAYLLATAAGGPIWSNLSDIFGRKQILLAAVFMFFATSIICALASSMPMLILGRGFQGIAGGGLIQLVNITISDLFSLRTRSLYLGLLEVMWAIAGGIGPVLGGTFTQYISWRWCFWINLPISGFAFVLLFIFLDVHNPKTRFLEGVRAIDWLGSFFILSFAVMLFVGLDLGGVTFSWSSPQVVCLLVFGSLMLVFFALSERKARYPLIPPDLVQNWSNLASLLLAFLHGMVYLGQEYYMPLYFQSALAASPVRSGVLTVPITVSEALMGIVCGVIIHRTGRYLELTYIGCFLMTLGVGFYTAFSANTTLTIIIVIELIAGLGAGCLFEPPLIALHACVSQERTASATSTLGFVRNIGEALSLVLGGVIFQNGMDFRIPALTAEGVPASVTNLLSNGAAAANVIVVTTIADPAQLLTVKEAFVWSIRNIWILYTCLSGLACVTSVFIGRRILGKVHTETKTGLH